jgi:hypothetical protein
LRDLLEADVSLGAEVGVMGEVIDRSVKRIVTSLTSLKQKAGEQPASPQKR